MISTVLTDPRAPLVFAGIAVAAVAVAAVVFTRTRAGPAGGGRLAVWTTRLIGGSGIAVASYGVVMFLLDAGLPLPFAVLGSVLTEGGIARFTLEVYRATRRAEDATVARRLVWALVATSAAANVVHAPADTAVGSVLFGIYPLLGALVIEFDAMIVRRRVRRAAGHDDRGGIGPRRVLAAAWRRGWVAAATALGIDLGATNSDTERELAARRAAWATYRLRLAQQNHEGRPGGRTERKVRRRTRAAQRARERAGVAVDQRQATRIAVLMRELVHGPEHATGDWSDIAVSASRVYGAPVVPYRAAVAADTAPYSAPYSTADSVPYRAVDGADNHADNPRTGAARPPDGTPTAEVRTAPRTTQDHRLGVGSADVRTNVGGSTPGPGRTSARTPRRTRRRAEPDVSDLVPLGHQVYAELRDAGVHVTRDRLAYEIRGRGQSLSADRAHALWRAVSNGHAPAAG